MIDGNERFLALLPAYNEAAHLEQVLKAVREQIRDILVVDDGKLVGSGNHEQLMKDCEVYQEIYYSQFPKEQAS